MLLETRKQISSLRAQLDGLVRACEPFLEDCPGMIIRGILTPHARTQLQTALSAIKNEAKKGK